MRLNYMAVMRLHNMARYASPKDVAQVVAQASAMSRVAAALLRAAAPPCSASPGVMSGQHGSHRSRLTAATSCLTHELL